MKMFVTDNTITGKDEAIWEEDLKKFMGKDYLRLEGHTKIDLENNEGIINYFKTVTGDNIPANIIDLDDYPSGIYIVISRGLSSHIFLLEQVLFPKLYGYCHTDGYIKDIFVVRRLKNYKPFIICNLYLYGNFKKLINRLGKYIYPENLSFVRQISNYNEEWGYEMVKNHFAQIWDLNPNENTWDLSDFLGLIGWNSKIIELISEERLLKVFSNPYNKEIFRNYSNFTRFIECLNALPHKTKNKIWEQVVKENADILKSKGFVLK